jgi:hypothetical protein
MFLLSLSLDRKGILKGITGTSKNPRRQWLARSGGNWLERPSVTQESVGSAPVPFHNHFAIL